MRYHRIGFTGTQAGLTNKQHLTARMFLRQYLEDGSQFHHGCCIGSDAQAHEIAWLLGYQVYFHPPSDQSKMANLQHATRIFPAKPYLERNHDIVDATECLLATPKDTYEHVRSGTWSTVRYARKLERPIYLIFPNGELTRERASGSHRYH